MDLEKVVVYQPFYNVEQSPPKENPAPKGPGHNGSRSTVDLDREQHEPNEHGDPRERVEEAIPERVPLQPEHSVDGLVVADHVVPLEDLVEQYAVDEAAQPDAQQNAGRAE
ncbi:MAG TPA: hypothetical protein VHI11_10120 [Jiangellaceae bacterium]|nr:hypothetical protein [Jiangellaceae bacterium]